jgi:hypothetical protein
MEQMTLDEAPRERHLRVATNTTELKAALSKASINAAFQRFHRNNPQVLAKLIELAEIAQRGGRYVGIRMLWEVMRWDLTIKTDAGEDFKLNDHYTSRYVRLIQSERPDLAEMFRTRTLRAP